MGISVRKRFAGTVAAVAAVVVVLATVAPAHAATPVTREAGVAQPAVVNPVPGTITPSVGDGTIKTMVQVGNRIYVGGTFTKVSSPGGAAVARNQVFAFDAATGVVDHTFKPAVDGEVDAILAGPDGTSVYVAGKFKNVNGLKSKSLALVDQATGATRTGFKVPAMDGIVTDLVIVNGRLYLAGTFGQAGTVLTRGLATLNPTTGAPDGFNTLSFSGNHNYPKNGSAQAGVGLLKFDVTPDGRKLIVIGNFTKVNGQTRDQIARLDLTGATVVLDQDWNTNAYTPACFANAYDSYVRGIQISPDGTYFVVVTTGGYYANTFQACDAAARFEVNSTGLDVKPTWVDFTGTDSLYSVAVTGTAVYIGGHQRWLNNPYGQDNAGPGAVPRPGLAALDPNTGLPLAWNPGRNTRGHGAEALLATSQGLYVGSDTSYIGNYQYKRDRIAYFPLAGGTTPVPDRTGTLPGTTFLGGRLSNGGRGTSLDDLQKRSFTGTSAGATTTITGTPLAWSQVRGAFMVNGVLYYGQSDGNLYRRTFNGTTFGAATLIDPYNDPYWANVQTGSGQTFRGNKSSFYGEIKNITAMTYAGNTIYYSLAGDPVLHARPFSLSSGIVGPTRSDVPSSISFSDAGGMFAVNGVLYVAGRSDGILRSVAFANGQVTGPATAVSGPANGADWRTRALFLLAP